MAKKLSPCSIILIHQDELISFDKFFRFRNNPKSIIFLGQRMAIAKEVIVNLLDTLTDNDYVNVFNFSSKMESMIDCFSDVLVPANRQNIRRFKIAARDLKVNNQSEMLAALGSTYDVLHAFRNSKRGTQCNQLIVVITDGANEEGIQKAILKMDPERRVRIFTFLVGREITEIMKTRDMACQNRGRFSHIKDFSEIREQVQKYVPVLSRPIVLDQKSKRIEDRFFAYTTVYADPTVSSYDLHAFY